MRRAADFRNKNVNVPATSCFDDSSIKSLLLSDVFFTVSAGDGSQTAGDWVQLRDDAVRWVDWDLLWLVVGLASSVDGTLDIYSVGLTIDRGDFAGDSDLLAAGNDLDDVASADGHVANFVFTLECLGEGANHQLSANVGWGGV